MYKLTKRLIKTQKASKHIIFVSMDDLMDSGELLCKKMLFYDVGVETINKFAPIPIVP